jgi:anaphase-promoting complex subunit 7
MGESATVAAATEWLWHLAEGHAALESHHHDAAAEHFRALSRVFPDNLHAALQGAKASAARGDHHAAAAAFQRCRAADPHCVTAMDSYAELLYEHFGGGHDDDANDAAAADPAGLGGFGVLSAGFGFGSHGPSPQLSQLVNDLLATDSNRPESWAAAAMYWESRGESARALGYAERALRLDSLHTAAHVIKGQLCLRLKRADAAVGAFKQALALRPSMRCYAGLVAGYLLSHRHKEALAAAKEALRLMPDSPHALALLGDVHGKQPEGGGGGGGADRARRAYEAALALDPSAVGTPYTLNPKP